MPRNLVVIFASACAVALATACDRTPTGAELNDVAAMLSASNPSAAANSRIFKSTLPALFRESVAQVETLKGRTGVEELLGGWRDLQEELKAEAATASRAAIQAKLEAIHNEELAVVERVLGGRAITRAIGEANVALAEARAQIAAAAANGEDMTAASSVAQQAETRIATARRALTISETRAALDAASQAATLLAGLRYYMIEARRVAGLEQMVPEAVAELKESTDPSTTPMLEMLDRLNERTRAALRTGDRANSHALLAQVRAEQIRIVLRVLGDESAARLVAQVDERARNIAARLAAASAAGRDAGRAARMLHEAQDMNERARAALSKGDAALALDLGSHAAGLLNAIQHLTWN